MKNKTTKNPPINNQYHCFRCQHDFSKHVVPIGKYYLCKKCDIRVYVKCNTVEEKIALLEKAIPLSKKKKYYYR